MLTGMDALNWRSGTALCALLALTGCASRGPLRPTGPAASASAVSQWSTSAQGIVSRTPDNLSVWWTSFDDPTLTDLIDLAVRGNANIRIAEARLRQSRAERGLARAALLPSLQGAVSGSVRQGGAATLSPGFDASWEPDVFGRIGRGVDAASADLQAAGEDLHGAQVSLVAEVGVAYVELRTLQARLGIARRNETSQAETLTLTDFRARAGLVSRVDVEQAHTTVEQTRAQIPTLESGISQTVHGLSILAGLPPSALMPTLGPEAPLPAVPPEIAVAIPAEVLRQRPDVRAAERRIVAETARLAQRRASRYPQFALSGSLGATLVSGALTGGTSLVASAAGSLVQTVFDGGRIRQQVAIQTAVQEQAVASYEQTMLTALQEVENALVAFESGRRRLVSLTAAADAAGAAAHLALVQYTAGLADFQTVLDTGRTVLAIEDGVASAQGDRLSALIQLYKALGGGWSPGASIPAGKQTP
jgi:NodT family efflux transporter outer membrane factor (OMF) lipoprotein